MDRRTFLGGLGTLAASASTGWAFAPRSAWAAGAGERRLALVILRGGLDGLAAVPVPGDRSWSDLRGDDGDDEVGRVRRPGEQAPPAPAPTPLDGPFALHPGLGALMPLWQARELAIVHAVGTAYASRSHFDGQNVLENGTARPFGAPTGWLGRALGAVDGEPWSMAAGRVVPLVLRGPATASSVDPDRAPRVNGELLARIGSLWHNDPLMGPALAEAIDTEARIGGLRDATPLPGGFDRMYGADAGLDGRGRDDDGEIRGSDLDGRRKRDDAGALFVGRALAATDGPRVAVTELGGWDTHTGQSATLSQRLPELARTLTDLREGLGAAWASTVVVVATEFGRTAHPNGSGGTDHGVGGAAFLAGGALAGGRVIADWPGLADRDLVDGRDLRPTTDLRSVLKGLLRDHLGVDAAHLERDVFPDSGGARPMDGLVRAA